jgi:hypothetical protein
LLPKHRMVGSWRWNPLTGKPAGLWLWSPSTDLLWIAGGGSLLFAAVAVPALVAWPGASARTVLAFTALAMLCNFPHYAATYETIYRERVKRPDVWTILLASLIPTFALLFLAGAYVDAALPILLRIYIAWSAYHYAAQHFGIASLYSARASAPLTAFERRALKLAFVAVAFPAGLRGVRNGLDPVVGDLGTYFIGLAVLAASLAAFATVLIRRTRAGRAFPALPGPVIVLFAAQVAWTLLPSLRFVSSAPWVGTVSALWPSAIPFFHCAQYLGVVGWRARTVGPVRPLILFAGLVVGGLALFRGLGLVWGVMFSRPAQELLLVVAVANIHHFAIDGMIWRKRRMPSAPLAAMEPIAGPSLESLRATREVQASSP